MSAYLIDRIDASPTIEVVTRTEVTKLHGDDHLSTITRTNRRGQIDKRWISNDVPVTGVVRRERGGKLVQELLDWGMGEPPALPAQGN